MPQHQVTLIGCGKMGSAMLEGWLSDDALDAEFTIIEPESKHLQWLSGHSRVQHYTDFGAAIAGNAPASSIVVLAVKPQMMEDALRAMDVMASAAHAFLSIAAGIQTGWLQIGRAHV